MEWFYQHGLKVLGWVVVTNVVTPVSNVVAVTNSDIASTELEITADLQNTTIQERIDELLTSIENNNEHPRVDRINPHLDFNKNPNAIPIDFILFYMNPKRGVPEQYVKSFIENNTVEKHIETFDLKRVDTQYYSLVLDNQREQQFYRDGVTGQWAVNTLPFKLNKRKWRADPVQVGNSVYVYDNDGIPWITFDGRVWGKCKQIAKRRLEWLLEYADAEQITNEAFGGVHETKHAKRTGKKRGTRS